MNKKRDLLYSLEKQEKFFNESLILNPVENIPFDDILFPSTSFLHGLYNTDMPRTAEEKYNSKIQFSGRNLITEDITYIYSLWANILGGEDVSMRLLSGLHAHTILFMGLTDIGDKVVLLPEKAGGHTSGKAILQRLGLNVKELPIDYENCRVDIKKAILLLNEFQPDILFIDRSEGLVYEDFTELCQATNCYKIFDASQYLTNIISNDYKNPFEMGFDLILSTLHKNLPGPQRAFLCTKYNDNQWKRIRSHISTFVSNMHVFSIYSAGLILNHYEELKHLSKTMLENTIILENELQMRNVPVIKRKCLDNELPTHHCWIKPDSQEETFRLYLSLEKIGLMVNYRLLPYDIGYGLRLGLSGATMSGLQSIHLPELASYIAEAYRNGYSDSLKQQTKTFIIKIKDSKL